MTAADPAFAADWRKAPEHVPGGAGDLHLWRARLTPAPTAGALTQPERDRASAYRFDADRDRFLARRAALRVAIASHLGSSPADVEVAQRCPTCGSLGHGPLHVGGGLSVSLSAAGDIALVAVSTGAVGVDVERASSDLDLEGAERTALAATELAALPTGLTERTAAFLRLWTAKEAVLKAGGTGLAADPRAVAIDGDAGIDAAGTRWHVQRIEVSAGYLAAVATAEPPKRIAEWEVALSAVSPPRGGAARHG